MSTVRTTPAIESLRAQVRKIESKLRRATSVLPFGLAEVDSRLPAGGLALGSLHEGAGGGNGRVRQSSYEKDGETRYGVDLVCTDFGLLAAKQPVTGEEEETA